ncbi:MAG: hypothetical protein ACYTGQ_05000 [Planctomycetota bacterium]|jgi:hypothetical protein
MPLNRSNMLRIHRLTLELLHKKLDSQGVKELEQLLRENAEARQRNARTDFDKELDAFLNDERPTTLDEFKDDATQNGTRPPGADIHIATRFAA